jgi:hypothetical protein
MKSRTDWLGMWQVWGRRGIPEGLWWGKLMEIIHWECLSVDGRIILRTPLKKYDRRT